MVVYKSKAPSFDFLVDSASFLAAFTLETVEAISFFNVLNSDSASASSASSYTKESLIDSINLVNSVLTFSKDSAEKVDEIYNKLAIGFNFPIFYN